MVIVRADADAESASALRCILEALPRDRVGELHIEEVRCTVPKASPALAGRAGPNLAILILGAEAARSAEAEVVALKEIWPKCHQLVVLPENLASKALPLMESGASDFVLPPIRSGDVIPRVLHLLRPRENKEHLVSQLTLAAGPRQIVGESPGFRAQLRKLPLIAGCDATVLVSGETGTGKELCARAIHYLSRRAARPFVPVDCGAIPAELIENEFFGHERGAYTTALATQRGLIEEAAGGSLFLDEIDSLPMSIQVKLLRFLQEKEYRSLGSTKVRRADVRVIAATNISLDEAVRLGQVRQDLYYRLNVLSISMPPLRDRLEDIPLMARHFVEKYAAQFSRPARDITEDAVKRLVSYRWPGNARELENLIERAVLGCDGPLIDVRDVQLPIVESDNARLLYQARKDRMVADWERDELKRMLAMYRGNVSAIARAEGKDPSAFRALLRKHHLRPDRASPFWNIRA